MPFFHFEPYERESTLQKRGLFLLERKLLKQYPETLTKFPVKVYDPTIGLTVHTWAYRQEPNGYTLTLPDEARCLYLILPCRLKLWISPSELVYSERAYPMHLDSKKIIFEAGMQQDGGIRVPLPWYHGMVQQGWTTAIVSLTGPGLSTQFNRNVSRNVGNACFYVPEATQRGIIPLVPLKVVLEPIADTTDQSNLPLLTNGVIDWFQTELSSERRNGFLTLEGNRVIINSSRSNLSIKRRVMLADIAWFMGFFIAEGKKQSYTELTVSQVNYRPLIKCKETLVERMGLHLSDLVMDTRHREEYSRAEIQNIYHKVGVALGHDRIVNDENVTFSGTLRVSGSLAFADLVMYCLQKLASLWERQSEDAVLWPFLIGYLDGDGTVTMNREAVALRFHDEDTAVSDLMTRITDRLLKLQPNLKAPYQDGDASYKTSRSLRFPEIVMLLSKGAFSFNQARARLFHVAANQYRKLVVEKQTVGFSLHRYFDPKTGEFANDVKEAIAIWNQPKLQLEAAFVQNKFPDIDDVKTGIKGVAYYFSADDPKCVDEAEQTKTWLKRVKEGVAIQRDTGSLYEKHLPEKTAQIRRVLQGRTELMIYEVHPGDQGNCTSIYREFGSVFGNTEQEDHRIHVKREAVSERKYDVVDLDPDGYPFAPFSDAVLLLKPNGVLFLTCVNPAPSFRRSVASKALIAGFGLPPVFSCDELSTRAIEVAQANNVKLQEISRVVLGRDSLWRLAFRVVPKPTFVIRRKAVS